MLKTFKIVGYAEGVSFLLLLGVAMPLKYVWGEPLAVRYVGMAHGLLFVAYIALLGVLRGEYNWSARRTLEGFAAAVLPFGTFIFERKLSRELGYGK